MARLDAFDLFLSWTTLGGPRERKRAYALRFCGATEEQIEWTTITPPVLQNVAILQNPGISLLLCPAAPEGDVHCSRHLSEHDDIYFEAVCCVVRRVYVKIVSYTYCGLGAI